MWLKIPKYFNYGSFIYDCNCFDGQWEFVIQHVKALPRAFYDCFVSSRAGKPVRTFLSALYLFEFQAKLIDVNRPTPAGISTQLVWAQLLHDHSFNSKRILVM